MGLSPTGCQHAEIRIDAEDGHLARILACRVDVPVPGARHSAFGLGTEAMMPLEVNSPAAVFTV